MWHSERPGGWIRRFINQLGILPELDRRNYRLKFIKKYGGEALKASEATMCPLEYTVHHKNLKRVRVEGRYENGVYVDNKDLIVNNKLRSL